MHTPEARSDAGAVPWHEGGLGLREAHRQGVAALLPMSHIHPFGTISPQPTPQYSMPPLSG